MKTFFQTLESIYNGILGHLIDILLSALLIWLIPAYSDNAYAKVILLIILFVALTIVRACIIRKVDSEDDKYKFHHKYEHVLVEYHGNEVFIFQRFITYTNRESARRMHTRKTWFSDESFAFHVTTPGFSTESFKKEGSDNELYIVFDKDYVRKEDIVFNTEFIGANENRNFCNFYEQKIEAPTSKLIFELVIPSEYIKENGRVELQAFLNSENSTGNVKKYERFDGQYEWIINNPKTEWSYRLSWEWSDEEQKVIASKHKGYR